MRTREITSDSPTEWRLVEISTSSPIWDRIFTVAPLVLVGTKEGNGYDVAPKHLGMPLGWDNYFGFVCSPRHATYRNIDAHGQLSARRPDPPNEPGRRCSP